MTLLFQNKNSSFKTETIVRCLYSFWGFHINCEHLFNVNSLYDYFTALHHINIKTFLDRQLRREQLNKHSWVDFVTRPLTINNSIRFSPLSLFTQIVCPQLLGTYKLFNSDHCFQLLRAFDFFLNTVNCGSRLENM